MPAWSYTVIIDPGHGGEELGAVFGKVNEKDLCLDYAKALYKELSPHVSTYMTRSVDRTVSLQERADLAEKVQADLLISIHFNSYENPTPSGFETYYLDNHADVAVTKVEKVENKGLQGEDLVINQILIDLVVKKTVKSSKELATKIHTKIGKNMSRKFKINDRKVRPGLFYLLALAKRPGVLLEVGFISNPSELKKMQTESFKEIYAKSVAGGILDFARKYKKLKPSLF